jgi:hypothetical protein
MADALPPIRDGPGDGPDTLHGWKDIATHLGRSVRSAQRWEATLGLPVKRITTPDGGQIVYASRAEIDEWQGQAETRRKQNAAADASSDDDTDATADGDPDSTATSAAAAAGGAADVAVATRSRLVAIGSMGIVGALGGLIGIWLVTTAIPAWSKPVGFEVESAAVVARDASGREVWRHPLGQPAARPPNVRTQAAVGDIDGDGMPEVAMPVALNPQRSVSNTTDAVYVFHRDGRLRWRIQPELKVQRGGRVYEGPWRAYAIAVSSAPPGRLWIAYGHHTHDPSFVLEVTATGAQSIRQLKSGRISGLAHWRTATDDFLAVTGADDRRETPSLDIVDLNAPPARWPDDAQGLTCDHCPSAPPRALLLFPNTDITRASFRTTGDVYAANPEGPDRLRLEITNGAGPVALDTTAVVAADLTVEELTRTEVHWAAHRALEIQGRLDHPVERCPDFLSPPVVQKWTHADGWTELRVWQKRNAANQTP